MSQNRGSSYISTYVCVRAHVCLCIYLCVCVSVHIYTHYEYMYVCMYVCVCVYISICVCRYIHTGIYTHVYMYMCVRLIVASSNWQVKICLIRKWYNDIKCPQNLVCLGATLKVDIIPSNIPILKVMNVQKSFGKLAF